MTGHRVVAAYLGPDASLKRLAWAYGCAKSGSEDEARKLDMLTTRIAEMMAAKIAEECASLIAGESGATLPR